MKKAEALFEEAKRYYVSGACAGHRVNHVLGRPLYITRADGCYIYDVDGNKYTDFHSGSGAIMFGFNNPQIRKALEGAMDDGFFMNFDTEATVEFGRLFTTLVPTAEKIRLTNSGTEASMAAIRLARAYTGKNLIIKMDGQFHGMHHYLTFDSEEAERSIKVIEERFAAGNYPGGNVTW